MKKRKKAVPRVCSNHQCEFYGKRGIGNIILHSFYNTKVGRRRRYRCNSCGVTFCSTAGTPYHRLRKPRKDFDDVAVMSVEGVSKSSISRAKGLSWNTVARWQELAARYAENFNDQRLKDFPLVELQADELCTFVSSKKNQFWLFTAMEIWSRLWISIVAGRRSYRNVKNLLLDTISRARIEQQFCSQQMALSPMPGQ